MAQSPLGAVRTAIVSAVDRTMPALGLAYRRWRDRRWLAQVRQLEQGFRLCGPPVFSDWEPEERAVFERYLASADVCIDVGANIGLYTCLARSRGKHVVAIEPLPRNLMFLNRNIALNGFNDIEIFPVGVGAHPSVAPIYGFSDIASFVPGWSRGAAVHSERVELSTMDILIGDRFAGQRLLIKIDVEGFELDVLRGAARLLARTPKPVWMIEVLLDNPLAGTINPSFEETFRLLFENGYRAFHADRSFAAVNQDDVARWLKAGTLGTATNNFIFYDEQVASAGATR